MRVLFVQDHLRSGGTEHQSILMAARLAAAGHVARLLTFRPGGPLSSLAASLDVDHRSLISRDLGLDLFAPGLDAAVGAFGPDIVACMGRSANCYGGRLARRHPRVAVIGTVRTGKALPWLNRRALRRVRGVVVNTRWWRDRLAADGIDAARIEVVPNASRYPAPGVPPVRDDGWRAERARHEVPSGAVVMISVAGFRSGKRQRDLIEACASLPVALDWRLWLVGDGPLRPACESAAARLGIAERVRFWGHRADPESLYRIADLAVSASVEDALPNFLVEAQCFGLPAVAADYRGVSEVVVDGRSGYLVSAGAADDLRARLAALLAEPGRRAEMGRAAARAAAASFDPAEQSARLVTALERLRTLPAPS